MILIFYRGAVLKRGDKIALQCEGGRGRTLLQRFSQRDRYWQIQDQSVLGACAHSKTGTSKSLAISGKNRDE